MAKISVSILNSDFLELGGLCEELKNCGVEMLHLDVMDGEFVPNISFGVPVIESIKKHTSLPLDIHLMVARPDRYVDDFCKYGEYVGIHYEAGSDIVSTLKKIKENGCKTVLTIKPKTEAECIFEYLPLCDMVLIMSVEPGFGGQKFMKNSLTKAKKLSAKIKELNLKTEIEIDGGINEETAKKAKDAGVTVLVAGSYIVNAKDKKQAIDSLR